jgi:hypothetical protein
MNQLVSFRSSATLPELVAAAGEHARVRFLEFFAANIRNPHTRRAYYRASEEFLTWCASAGVIFQGRGRGRIDRVCDRLLRRVGGDDCAVAALVRKAPVVSPPTQQCRDFCASALPRWITGRG